MSHQVIMPRQSLTMKQQLVSFCVIIIGMGLNRKTSRPLLIDIAHAMSNHLSKNNIQEFCQAYLALEKVDFPNTTNM